MDIFMTIDQRETYVEKLTNAWLYSNYFGVICSDVDRTNDVVVYLDKLGVDDLIPYLLINEKTKAFVYVADLLRKDPINVVEIYHDWGPRSTEWRKRGAEFALQLDEDLIGGLDDGVAIPKLVVPFGETALEEVLLYN